MMYDIRLGGINPISDFVQLVTYSVGDKQYTVMVPINENIDKYVKEDYERRKKDGVLI